MNPLTFLLRLFGGGIAGELRKWQEAKLKAETDKDKLEADLQLARLRGIQSERDRSSGFWEIRLVAFIAGFAASVHYALVAFVSSFPQIGWTVQKLPAPMDDMQMKIILSLFGLAALGRMLR